MLPSFASELAACVPTSVQAQLVALEADNMAGFERNGAPFDDYFKRWDLTVHIATASDGALMGFAISGAEGRGLVFLYELHVAKSARKRGVARSLLDLVERSSPSRGRSRPTVELNVHRGNDALGFYEREGFAPTGELSGGDVIVMRRKR